jgi:DtxR family Mn-dependent transcriptional regulator
VIDPLVAGEPLAGHYRDHLLIGDSADLRGCHILPDWLLIYQTTETELILGCTGSPCVLILIDQNSLLALFKRMCKLFCIVFKRKQVEVKVGEDFLKNAAADCLAGEAVAISRIADAIDLDSVSMSSLLEQLQEAALVSCEDSVWSLTESGWTRGRQLLRAHRIYESYLAEQTGTPASDWHLEADHHEHLMDPDEVNRLAETLNCPRFDPHGDPIPTRDLTMEGAGGCLLSQITEAGDYRILHLEDEPKAPFERTIALGLGPGIVVRVELLNSGRYRAQWAGLDEVLDSEQAASCRVEACEAHDLHDLPFGNLKSVAVGQAVPLHSISPAVRGLQRRRLLDLGFVPGSLVLKEGVAAFHGPMRFRVRGTSQALRPDLAAMIYTKAIDKG